MVRLLVEEAFDALPLPNPAQRGRNDRFVSLPQPQAPSREAGSFTGPISVIMALASNH
jgi:hypothetical protein